jgi:hypothetical protein
MMMRVKKPAIRLRPDNLVHVERQVCNREHEDDWTQDDLSSWGNDLSQVILNYSGIVQQRASRRSPRRPSLPAPLVIRALYQHPGV